MIFFIINPEAVNDYEYNKPFYEIPVSYQEPTEDENKLNEYNCQLISWNQAKYTNKEGKTPEIKTVKELFSVVLEVARDDEVCKKMNSQFKAMYLQNEEDKKEAKDVYDLFEDFLRRCNPSSPDIKEDEITLDMLFKTIYDCWPDPLIGNIANNFYDRPIDADMQCLNWLYIQEEYMSDTTKDKIICLCGICDECPRFKENRCQLDEDHNYLKRENAGLKKRYDAKLGRDQVRICKDWTELSRAVFGEITSYISKMLEKIYALELCQSDELLKKQKELLLSILDLNIKSKDNKSIVMLKSMFDDYHFEVKYTSLYFDMLIEDKCQSIESDWDIFALFIYSIFKEEYAENGIDLLDKLMISEEFNTPEKVKDIVQSFNTLPATMRCAMIIYDISNIMAEDEVFMLPCYSIVSNSNGHLFLNKASGRRFLPRIRNLTYKGGQLAFWNWMRDEYHVTTVTNRELLMPLWAGSSVRASNLIEYYHSLYGNYFQVKSNIYSKEYIITDNKGKGKEYKDIKELHIALAECILPSMFAFWRLYYDKRISGIYTLEETFEAFYVCTGINTARIYYSNDMNIVYNLTLNKKAKYDNVWQTLDIRFDVEKDINGEVIYTYNKDGKLKKSGLNSPVGIMRMLYNTHYNSDKSLAKNIKDLKAIIQGNINRIAKTGAVIIEWSKDGLIVDAFRNFDYSRVVYQEGQNEPTQSLIVGNGNNQLTPKEEKECTPNKKSRPLQQSVLQMKAVQSENNVIQYLLNEIQKSQDNKSPFKFERNEKYNISLPICLTDSGIVDFLGEIEFTDITVDETRTSDSMIVYEAKVNTESNCWSCIRSTVSGLKANETIKCTVYDNDGFLTFRGEIDIDNSKLTIGQKLKIKMNSLIIESGLSSDWISVSIAASISGENKTIDITMLRPLYSSSVDIYGEYENDEVLTITDFLDMFGFDVQLNIPVISDLGLHSFEARISGNPFNMDKLSFVVSTKEPLTIIDDKIAFCPVFEIDIDQPFNDDRRDISWEATGEFSVGKSKFDIKLTSYNMVYAGLAKGSVLNFKEIAEMFANGVEFPSNLTFTDISFVIDYASKNYSLSIAAENIYEFSVGGTTFKIKGISCYLEFENGSFGVLNVAGTLEFGKIDLDLYGSYSKGNNISFYGDAYSNPGYDLKAFISDITGNDSKAAELFPDEIISFCLRKLNVSYDSSNGNFLAFVDIENTSHKDEEIQKSEGMIINDTFSLDDLKLRIASSRKADEASDMTSELDIKLQAYMTILDTLVILDLEKDENGYTFKGDAEFENGSVRNLLEVIGVDISSVPEAFLNFTVKSIKMGFAFLNDNTKKISFEITTSLGKLDIGIDFGERSEWHITYMYEHIDILRIPVAGEIVKKICSDSSNTKIEIDYVKVEVSSKKGLTLGCRAFGKDYPENQVQKSQDNMMMLSAGSSGPAFSGTAVWYKINKTLFIVTIPKIGIGIEEKYITLLLDASLNVAPLTISFKEAGIGISMEETDNPVRFYLSGFGIGFDNGIISIGGDLSISEEDGKTVYSGKIVIRFKAIGITGICNYSDGSMMAYLSTQAPIGGIPAFFIKGVAAGFGYNKRLKLPSIEEVNKYPLITAAMSGFNDNTKNELNKYVEDEAGQYFLAAGLKFTTYDIINGFILATVSFGNETELGLLGLADLTVPPNVNTGYIARAQLAIKSTVNISQGFFCAEARLTNESYILSKSCRLTGGFAAYVWFGDNKHSGDFVITLGGYHPSYNKPKHYPVVPRLGFNWKVNNNINISGELYFALTPNSIMAGGKLSAVYTLGNLKAWFIAYADILMNWKPFSYDISIGISVGASYTVDFWFIHKTFSIELGADLHLWGPEVQARVHISWFIISFTIAFSEGEDHSKDELDWNGFVNTFLVDNSSSKNLMKATKDSSVLNEKKDDILSISFEGIIGRIDKDNDKEIEIISPRELSISALSKIPASGYVRPTGGQELTSQFKVKVEKDNEEINLKDAFESKPIYQNLPAALWAKEAANKLSEDSLVNSKCGTKLSIIDPKPELELFPSGERFIRLSELFKKNNLDYENSFKFSGTRAYDLVDEEQEPMISKFKENEKEGVIERRKQFLSMYEIDEDISISDFASKAEDLLSEDILILNAKGDEK